MERLARHGIHASLIRPISYTAAEVGQRQALRVLLANEVDWTKPLKPG